MGPRSLWREPPAEIAAVELVAYISTMNRRCVKILLAGLAAFLGACAADETPPSTMTVQIALTERNYCSIGRSPRMTLQRVPANAARLRVRAVNADVLIADPWEGIVAAVGSEIPEGALAEYRGPCPGSIRYDRYRYTVTAETGDGSALARAETLIVFPPLPALLQARQRGLPAPTAPPLSRGPYPTRQLLLGDPSDPVFYDD
jgi:hypothetical protein